MGIEARAVREVLGAREARPLAAAPEAVLGVLEWRGRAIALVDVGRLLGSSCAAPPRAPRVAVVECSRGTFAIGADAVREVQAVERERVGPSRPEGIGRVEIELWGIPMVLLDPERVADVVLSGERT